MDRNNKSAMQKAVNGMEWPLVIKCVIIIAVVLLIVPAIGLPPE
jgi:hypothetical protein